MRRSGRTKTRIDYRHFNLTGDKRIKDQSMDVNNLKVEIEVLREDIHDFMDENEAAMDASDSQSIISKLEDYRTSFRSKVILLRQNTKDDNADYFAEQEEVLVKIKAFIKESKDVNASSDFPRDNIRWTL